MGGSLLDGGLDRLEACDVVVDLMGCSCSYCIAVEIGRFGNVLVVDDVLFVIYMPEFSLLHLFLTGLT